MVDTIVSGRQADTVRAAFTADPRGELTLAAAAEIEAIGAALQRRFCAADCPAEDLAFRALAIRVERLAATIVSCVDDAAADLGDVRRAIEGPELTRARLAAAS